MLSFTLTKLEHVLHCHSTSNNNFMIGLRVFWYWILFLLTKKIPICILIDVNKPWCLGWLTLFEYLCDVLCNVSLFESEAVWQLESEILNDFSFLRRDAGMLINDCYFDTSTVYQKFSGFHVPCENVTRALLDREPIEWDLEFLFDKISFTLLMPCDSFV